MQIFDKLINFVANLGTDRDKQTATQYESLILDVHTLEALYDSNGFGGKIIDIPVDDMFKNWATLVGDDITPEMQDEITEQIKKLCVRDNVADATRWARLYGGSIIVMGIDGAGAEDTPLDLDRVKEDSLKFLHVIDRQDVSVENVNTTDINSPLYRKPEFYRVAGGTTRIHASRVLRFIGRPLPFRVSQNQDFWGAPVLQRVWEQLSQFDTVAAATATMIHEANLDVISIKGFANLVSTKDGQAKLLERFSLAAYTKSNQNMFLLDEQETYEKKSNSFNGLKDMNSIFAGNFAGVVDIPITRLMGQSPGGMNATGASDLENYYEALEAQRSNRIEPELDKLYNVLLKSTFGKDDLDYEYDWPPIGPVSEKEQADIEKIRAERDAIYIDKGVVEQSIVAKELHANKTYIAIDKGFLAAVDESVELDGVQGEEDRNMDVAEREASLNGDQNSDSTTSTTE